MKMFMKCNATGKYVKNNVEAYLAHEAEHPWLLVDSIEEATDDPGMFNGGDLSWEMIMFFARENGSASFSPVSPEEEEEEVIDVPGKTVVVGLGATAHVTDICKAIKAMEDKVIPICPTMPLVGGFAKSIEHKMGKPANFHYNRKLMRQLNKKGKRR